MKDTGLPDTLVCKTPAAERMPTSSCAKVCPARPTPSAKGLDVWNGPHYTILPPSNHYSGGTYTWEKVAAPAPWPDVLMPTKKERGRPVGTGKETFDPASKHEVDKLLYDLAFIDASDRETWVNVGIV